MLLTNPTQINIHSYIIATLSNLYNQYHLLPIHPLQYHQQIAHMAFGLTYLDYSQKISEFCTPIVHNNNVFVLLECLDIVIGLLQQAGLDQTIYTFFLNTNSVLDITIINKIKKHLMNNGVDNQQYEAQNEIFKIISNKGFGDEVLFICKPYVISGTSKMRYCVRCNIAAFTQTLSSGYAKTFIEKIKTTAIATIEQQYMQQAYALALKLRACNIPVTLLEYINFSKQLTSISKYNINYLIIIGEAESLDNTISVKNLHTRLQKNMSFDEFILYYYS